MSHAAAWSGSSSLRVFPLLEERVHARGDGWGLIHCVTGQIRQSPDAVAREVDPAKAHAFPGVTEYLRATWAVRINRHPFRIGLVGGASIHGNRTVTVAAEGQRSTLETRSGWWTGARAELTDDDDVPRGRWIRPSGFSGPHWSAMPCQISRIDILVCQKFGGFGKDTRTVRHPERHAERTPVVASILQRNCKPHRGKRLEQELVATAKILQRDGVASERAVDMDWRVRRRPTPGRPIVPMTRLLFEIGTICTLG